MAIPNAETRALKEEIEKALFKEAFIQLAVEFRRRDRKGFDIAALKVRRSLDNFPVAKFIPPAKVEASTVDLELLQQTGFTDALSSYDHAIRQIAHRTG